MVGFLAITLMQIITESNSERILAIG